jgi:phosphoglycerate dehydrogenase-like enzyme
VKIVLHYRAGPRLRSRLRELSQHGLEIVIVEETDRAGFNREIADADVLLHVLQPVTAEMISLAPRLKLIQKIGVGVNTIDRRAAERHRIQVANMPDTNSQAVAEHSLALMLCVLRRIVELDRATRNGMGWSLAPELFEGVGELAGRTVGLAGLGAVPRRLIPILEAFGAQWIYHTRFPKPGYEHRYRSLNALFEQADIVSLHVPLLPETRQFINADRFALMKPGSVLINTGRGELVDEKALAAALESGHLGGAGLDVFGQEPIGSDHPLLHLSNVVVSPHVAWLTPETLDRSLEIIRENCRRLIRNEALLNVVPFRERQ